MEWYYILGIISYGIFILQFILSNSGLGETDVDIDLDGELDFNVSDLISFKGLVHFIMGFSGWLMLAGKVTIGTLSVAALIGVVFVIILYFVYKLCMKFNHEPHERAGSELVGSSVIVYTLLSEGKYICYVQGDPSRELLCKCKRTLNVGETLKIDSFESGIYFIS